MLALDIDDRVRKFYRYHPDLLPAKRSPVPDVAVASFLAISKYQLHRTRNKLIRAGILRVVSCTKESHNYRCQNIDN